MSRDNFLIECKKTFVKNIHPFDMKKEDAELYKKLDLLGKEIIERDGLQDFLSFLMESQYRVNLWAAVLGLKYGNPSNNEILIISGRDTIIDHCLEVIERHVSYQTTAEQELNGGHLLNTIKTKYNKR
jgi:hypothetical protein